jgi:hypothetical protein
VLRRSIGAAAREAILAVYAPEVALPALAAELRRLVDG